MQSRHAAQLASFALVVTTTLALMACKGSEASKDRGLQSGDPNAPVPIEVATLVVGPIEDTLRYSATLRAEIQVAVLARTVGQVRQRSVEEGDQVKRNQLLARIEADEQSSAIKRIDNDLAQARRNLTRETELNKKGVVSEQVLERTKFEVERLEIARRDARRSLGYTSVRAPIAGTVTQRFIKYGDLVAPNQPLYEITDFGSLVAEVFVPEKDIFRVKVGATARLASPSSGDSLPGGVVERIAPIVDARSGTVKVTLKLPSAQESDQLRPGMFVDVHLVVASEASALLLPRRALVYDNDEAFAFRVVSGTVSSTESGKEAGKESELRVERVRVDIAIEDRQVVKPASNGAASFKVGDRVVIAGQVGLKDGALVEIAGKQDKSEPAPSGKPEPAGKPAEQDAKTK